MSTTPLHFPEIPEQPEKPDGDSSLEQLAAITGLFNPDQIVEELRQLDELDNSEEQALPPTPSSTE